MNKIAFIYTEYQQNVLFSICEQENFIFDIIFMRDTMKPNVLINKYSKKKVIYKKINYKPQNVYNYFKIFNSIIKPELNKNDKYIVFTWSINNPIVKFSLLFLKNVNIHLIEDGTGSYIEWKKNKILGIKSLIAKSLIEFSTNILSFSFKDIKKQITTGWSFFENCFPEFNLKRKLINKTVFMKIIDNQLVYKSILELKNNSLVFISSPYVEVGLLNEREYLNLLLEKFKSIKNYKKIKYFYWKSHPRISLKKEQDRIRFLKINLNIDINLLETNENIELIAVSNKNKKIYYTAFGSTSLYVLKTLNINNVIFLEIEWKNTILLKVNKILSNILDKNENK